MKIIENYKKLKPWDKVLCVCQYIFATLASVCGLYALVTNASHSYWFTFFLTIAVTHIFQGLRELLFQNKKYSAITSLIFAVMFVFTAFHNSW